MCVEPFDLKDFCGDHDLFLRLLYLTHRTMMITAAMITEGRTKTETLKAIYK